MQFSILLILLVFCFTYSVSPATINGRFQVLNTTSSEVTILMQINTNTGVDDLGGATIVFGFDTSAINYPSNPVKYEDYIFHNFNGGNYSDATVSRPMSGKIWINIDLPFTNSNIGTVVAQNPEWTDLVTIIFNVVDPNKTLNISWQTTSLFWSIYDADNMTTWENGVFEDFPTSVEPGSELPTQYALEQNYPNPFNPSTKIKFTIPSTGTKHVVSVQLKVYDILGNEVATLVNEEKEPGSYEVTFDSYSSAGMNLASGVYIYRLQASEFSDTKKMVLLR